MVLVVGGGTYAHPSDFDVDVIVTVRGYNQPHFYIRSAVESSHTACLLFLTTPPQIYMRALCIPTPLHQALFEEGAGGAAPENRLANFLRHSGNGPGGEEEAGADSVMETDEEGEGGGLW